MIHPFRRQRTGQNTPEEKMTTKRKVVVIHLKAAWPWVTRRMGLAQPRDSKDVKPTKIVVRTRVSRPRESIPASKIGLQKAFVTTTAEKLGLVRA